VVENDLHQVLAFTSFPITTTIYHDHVNFTTTITSALYEGMVVAAAMSYETTNRSYTTIEIILTTTAASSSSRSSGWNYTLTTCQITRFSGNCSVSPFIADLEWFRQVGYPFVDQVSSSSSSSSKRRRRRSRSI